MLPNVVEIGIFCNLDPARSLAKCFSNHTVLGYHLTLLWGILLLLAETFSQAMLPLLGETLSGHWVEDSTAHSKAWGSNDIERFLFLKSLRNFLKYV